MVIQKRTGKKGISYRVLVRIQHQTVTQTFHDEEKARRWGYEMQDNIRSGKAPQIEAAKQTFATHLAEFSRYPSRAHLKSHDRVITLLEEWAGEFGHLPVGAITTAMIQRELDKMARGEWTAGIDVAALNRGVKEKGRKPRPTRGPLPAPATVNRKRSALGVFFKNLVKRGILDTNPVTRTDHLSEPAGRVRYLSNDERARLFAACKVQSETTCPMLYTLVVVATYSGMRRGELMRLDWADVNLSTGQATVQVSKNGDRRSTSILGPALEALREWRGNVRAIGRQRVFPGVFPRHAWERAIKAAGLSDFHFHDLRHTAASYLAMTGASNRELQDFLGHKTLAMVQRYAHLSPAHMRTVVERMTERFG